jgi:hypothetical protein
LGGIAIGLSHPGGWLLTLCFVFSAFKVLDWRSQIGLLALSYFGEMAASHYSAIGELLHPTPVGGSTEVIVTFSAYHAWPQLIHCASATLLGAVVSPFWCRREIAPLRNRLTPIFLSVVVGLQFIAADAYSTGAHNALVLGGVAYLGGMVWRVKGIVVVPPIIQMCCLLSYAAFGDDEYLAGSSMSEMIRLGATAFTFAFFGLLSNRYDRSHENSGGGARATMPVNARVLE